MKTVYLVWEEICHASTRADQSMFVRIEICLSQHEQEFIVGREECKVDLEDEDVYHFSLENTVLHDVRFAEVTLNMKPF